MPMRVVWKDGPKCPEMEAARTYVDDETKDTFGITYTHTLESSIDDAISNLPDRNLWLVGSQK